MCVNNEFFQECGGRLQGLEEQLKQLETAEAVVAAKCKSAKSNIVTEEKKLKQLEKSLSDVSIYRVIHENSVSEKIACKSRTS